MPGTIQEKEFYSSLADEVEEKELIVGGSQYDDGVQSNTEGDSSKRDSVEEPKHVGTNEAEKELIIGENQQKDGEHGKTDGEVGTNTAEKGTVHNPDKEEVQKQNDHQEHDEHVDIEDTRLHRVKQPSKEATVVDEEQLYVEQDADPPDHSSSEKDMVISQTDQHQVTFCRKSSPVKELHDLISHNIDSWEVEEDARDLHKEDKEENIKQNKENILKQENISPNSKFNNKGQKKGKKNAIDKQIPLRVVPKRNATKSNVK
ncbi:uncharacterized protein LOC132637532 [Lycium barbarum]|uniref:uncharacterized protein LOC132637532 n=1 Tax=Lycium barbarum TaxID=112863 RepID=UPI00293E6155|nr:uncharacterized protein LOC132637532 [Lycium barbarum]